MRAFTGLVAVFFVSCFSGYKTEAPSASGAEMKVRRGDFSYDVVLTGEVEAARGAMIAVPQLPTWETSIKWLIVDGTEVKAGDRVVELDNTAFINELETKKQAFTQATQELQQREAEWSAELEQKELDVERREEEFAKAKLDAAIPRDIVSLREYEENQKKLLRTSTEFEKARELYKSQQKAVAADRENLTLKLLQAQRDVEIGTKAIDALVLRAPRDGIVVVRDIPWESRKLQAGDSVWVGFPLALIPEVSSLRVAASLADVDDRRIHVGLPVEITLDAYPTRRFPGRVSSISAVAQEVNRNSLRRTFRVLVDLEQIDPELMRPGFSARASVRTASRRGVLLAPRVAIDFSGASPRVRSAGKWKNANIGECNAHDCVVTGLEEGQRLESVSAGEVNVG